MSSPASRALLLTAGVTAAALLPVSAQEQDRALSQLYHTAWTTREGAPAHVSALAQTADGFLWLGTHSGLFRFDSGTAAPADAEDELRERRDFGRLMERMRS